MRAATIRRCLVFGVCALGVGGLYLAPSLGRSSYQVSQPTLNDEPTAQPRATGNPASVSLTSSRSTAQRSGRSPEPSSTTSVAQSSTPAVETSPAARPRQSARGATAYDPDSRDDAEPPQPVQKITPLQVTADQLSLDWPPARDNVRVIGYHIWLSGYQVASTAETHATVRWFNDDTAQHVVQVKAVDAAGNEAESSPTLLVSRPDPDRTPAPETSELPTTDPEPTPQATDSTAPSESPKMAPAEPTADSSGTAGSN